MKDGGPAFPNTSIGQASGGNAGGCLAQSDPGMTLRDWFAGQALCGMFNSYSLTIPAGQTVAEARAKIAYLVADAMLAEREKENGH